MGKADASVPAEVLAIYERLVATVPGLERKGAAIPYTSLNGNMFSQITKTGRIALRLPADARAAFLAKHPSAVCVQYGIVMKEYVEVPDAVLKKSRDLEKLFAASFAYVSSLRPKATTRKKKPAAPRASPRRS